MPASDDRARLRMPPRSGGVPSDVASEACIALYEYESGWRKSLYGKILAGSSRLNTDGSSLPLIGSRNIKTADTCYPTRANFP